MNTVAPPPAFPWRVRLAVAWDAALPVIFINGVVSLITLASLTPAEWRLDQPWKWVVVGYTVAGSVLAVGAVLVLLGQVLVRRVRP